MPTYPWPSWPMPASMPCSWPGARARRQADEIRSARRGLSRRRGIDEASRPVHRCRLSRCWRGCWSFRQARSGPGESHWPTATGGLCTARDPAARRRAHGLDRPLVRLQAHGHLSSAATNMVVSHLLHDIHAGRNLGNGCCTRAFVCEAVSLPGAAACCWPWRWPCTIRFNAGLCSWSRRRLRCSGPWGSPTTCGTSLWPCPSRGGRRHRRGRVGQGGFAGIGGRE